MGSGRDLVAMMMYYRVRLYAQMVSWLDKCNSTHVRIYEREDGGIGESAPPVAQERGWHPCGGYFEWEVRVKVQKLTKRKIVRPAFFDMPHPTR